MKCHHCKSKVNDAFVFDTWYHCRKCRSDFDGLTGAKIEHTPDLKTWLLCGCPACEKKVDNLAKAPVEESYYIKKWKNISPE